MRGVQIAAATRALGDQGCAQTLEKKAFARHPKTKKCLRKRSGVLFFAAILLRGGTALHDTTFEE